MKLVWRILTALLCLCTVMLSLSSCLALARLSSLERQTETETDGQVTQVPDLTTPGLFDFTLTDETKTRFDEQRKLCESLLSEGTDTERIEAEMAALEEIYYYTSEQSQIAYILYCCDPNDETASQNYLYAGDTASELYEEYLAMCKRLYESDSPYREAFFADWTQQEIDEMRNYSNAVTELTQANERILVSYRDLSDAEFDAQTPVLYYDLVNNNNAIAVAMGYENYYEYANRYEYARDYGTDEVAAMRAYASRYLVPLLQTVYTRFYESYTSLTKAEQTLLLDFLDSDYDALKTDYLDAYLDAVSAVGLGTEMRSLLEEERAVFTDYKESYSGAFTTYLSVAEIPVCYFGPGYQSTMTVAHEMGHYYAALYAGGMGTQLDLAELQSQGNEYLLLAAIEEMLDADVYEALEAYLVYDQLCSVLICLIVDEFEQCVYTESERFADPDRFDTVIEQICARYGGIEFISAYVVDINYYWRAVTLESPVYYLSYATSGLAALGLYVSADASFEPAVQTYLSLAQSDGTLGFCEAIAKAGLFSPFEEAVYTVLKSAFS